MAPQWGLTLARPHPHRGKVEPHFPNRIRRNAAVQQNFAQTSDPVRPLRYLWRVPLLLLQVLVALPVTMLLMLPPWSEWRTGAGESVRERAVRVWQRNLLRVFGMRVVTRGAPAEGAVLMVANHFSWIEITLMHSQRMLHFVAKSEIASWPLVGMLAARAGTLFHRRGSTESLGSVQEQMVAALRAGAGVGVFPEGSAGPADQVRVFHARILQPAVATGAPVQPVALRFMRGGRLALDVGFRKGEKFLPCFFRVLGAAPSTAEVIFLPPLTDHARGRRWLANASRAAIVGALGLGETDPAASEATTLDEAVA